MQTRGCAEREVSPDSTGDGNETIDEICPAAVIVRVRGPERGLSTPLRKDVS
jgi:hypothetical protein